MKIAVLVNCFPVTSETFIINQIVGLLQRGHEVDIHAFGRGDDAGIGHKDIEHYRLLDRVERWPPTPVSWIERIPSAIVRIAASGWRRPDILFDSLNVFRHGKFALNLSRLHKRVPAKRFKRQYDVIQCHYGPNGQRAIDLKTFGVLEGPVVTSFHGYDANRLPRIHGTGMYEDLFRSGDLFTVGSDFMKRRIVELGAPAERIVKMPMGVDVAKYRAVERGPWRGAPRLLTVARLVEVKGIEYALRAVAIAKRDFPDIQYTIVGDGPFRSSLEELTKNLGLEGNAAFLGALPAEKIAPLYASADLFLLPSIITDSGEQENQPVALAEAQAAGVPVIASAIGGIPESIVDGVTGCLVPPRDPESLARAIISLAQRSQDWPQMARAARAHADEHFNLDRLNDGFVALYQQLAAAQAKAVLSNQNAADTIVTRADLVS